MTARHGGDAIQLPDGTPLLVPLAYTYRIALSGPQAIFRFHLSAHRTTHPSHQTDIGCLMVLSFNEAILSFIPLSWWS